MTRLGDTLGRVQRFGAHISAYRAIGWLGAIAAGVGVVAFQYAMRTGALLLIAIVVEVMSVGLLLTSLILFRRTPGGAYRWLSAEYVYRFHPPPQLQRQIQTITIRIKANRDNVCCFESSYYWSGGDNSTVRVVSDGHRFVAEAPADDAGRKRYWIHLDTPLNRGDETEIRIEQDLFDDRCTLRPMLAKAVLEPVGSLTLKVIIPRDVAPARTAMVARQSRFHEKSRTWREVQRDVAELDSDNGVTEFSYSPEIVRVGRRYELDWGPWKEYPKAGKVS